MSFYITSGIGSQQYGNRAYHCSQTIAEYSQPVLNKSLKEEVKDFVSAAVIASQELLSSELFKLLNEGQSTPETPILACPQIEQEIAALENELTALRQSEVNSAAELRVQISLLGTALLAERKKKALEAEDNLLKLSQIIDKICADSKMKERYVKTMHSYSTRVGKFSENDGKEITEFWANETENRMKAVKERVASKMSSIVEKLDNC